MSEIEEIKARVQKVINERGIKTQEGVIALVDEALAEAYKEVRNAALEEAAKVVMEKVDRFSDGSRHYLVQREELRDEILKLKT